MPMAKTRWGRIAAILAVTGAWLLISTAGARSAEAFKMGVVDPQVVLEAALSVAGPDDVERHRRDRTECVRCAGQAPQRAPHDEPHGRAPA